MTLAKFFEAKYSLSMYSISTITIIPRCIVAISPGSTHYVKLATEVVDTIVIKGLKSLSRSSKRRLLQQLCLNKDYKSAEEEQKLIKRGYVLDIPIKKKGKRKRKRKRK